MKKYFFLNFLIFFFFSNFSLIAQNNTILLKDFDRVYGKNNLEINNGTLHSNTFRTINDKIRYYSKNFLSGTLYYEGDVYYEVPLKFDEFEEQLILKLQKSNTNFGLNLITQKVDSFAFGDTKFINLSKVNHNYAQSNNLSFVEKKSYSKHLHLYINHSKNKKDKIEGSSVYYEFAEMKSFFVSQNEIIYKVSSRSDFYSIFPSKKKAIKKFYKNYKTLRKDNELKFIDELLKHLSV
ncbi:hypothetical protein RBU60_08435 [Mesonia sp. MT50]|uniref:YARHG domain-containing protein n=1 Tax=Mesonia profundi TaxID=3070998 RepID=A0ABU1A1L7_9FLAO|nr:hypothetical protein [Mesonia profundi]MDQ7917599.1 hypothetical protein [Mesonia profundi]